MDVRCKSKNVKILEQANKKYGRFCNHHSLTTGRRGYASSHLGVINTHTLHYITHYTLHYTLHIKN